MKYRILEKDFIKAGWHFKQIERTGDYAIYSKQYKDHKSICYEAIKISRHDGYEIAGVAIEPAETYPSNEQWGILGFSPSSLQEARKKIKWMIKRDEENSKRKL
jgi:hypothetical protein